MKKLLPLLVIGGVVLFIGYWMMTDPRTLADFTGDGTGWAVDAAGDVASGLKDFLVELFG